MWLDKLSQHITSFRYGIILGTILFLIGVSSFFSGEWNSWLAAIFLILVFPLVFYTVLLLRDNPGSGGGKFDFRSPYLYLSIFLIMALVSAFFSMMKYDSWHYWSLLLGYGLVFWVVASVFHGLAKVKIITIAIFCTGVLASLINLFLFLKDPSTRAGGALLNANALGSYLLFSLPIGLALTIDARGKKSKLLFGLGTLIVLVSFVLTFSYTGWVSFLMPLVIIMLVYRRQLLTKRNVLFFFALVAVLIAVVIGVRYLSTHDMAQSLAFYRTVTGSHFMTSMTQRWNFILSTLHIFRDNPLVGTGLATFQQVYTRYALTVIEQPRYVHNYYLQTAAEIGVVGFLALVGFIITLLIRAWRTVKNSLADEQRRPYYLGLGLAVLGSIIHSLFDFGWQFPAVFLLFWISGGLLLGARSENSQDRLPTTNPVRRMAASIATVAVIIISLALFARGITLFVGQSYFERAEPKKADAKLDEALPLYKTATRFDPAPDKLRPYANALFEQGVQKKDERQADYDEADRIFQSITAWNLNDYFTYHQAGRVYFMRKEYERAEEQYKLAIQYDPIFHPDFQYDLAFLYFTQKRYELISPVIQPVLDRYAGITESANQLLPRQLAFLNLLLGKSYATQGDNGKARQYYEAALVRDPTFTLAKSELEQLP